jgi:hypothetical protein
MRSALETIARLNAVPRRRFSWRHGSIAWRQRYLDSLIGRPLRGLPIDRLVRRLKLAIALTLLATGVMTAWSERAIAPERPRDGTAAAHGPPASAGERPETRGGVDRPPGAGL